MALKLPINKNGDVVLDIGCGVKPHPEASITIDSEPSSKPTYLCDLTNNWPLPDSSVDKIFARSVLEHIPHKQTKNIFNEVERVLKIGGEFSFSVPHFFSHVAADDPTHYSFWTLRTVDYFCGDRMPHVFKKSGLIVSKKQVKVDFPTPLTFLRWPHYRITISGGPVLEQFMKLPFVFGQIYCSVKKIK